MPQEGNTAYRHAADLRNVAAALRVWATPLEDGTFHTAQHALKQTGYRREKLAPEAAQVLEKHEKAAASAAKLVKDKLYLLTSCADTYGCTSLSQEAIAWLKAAVAQRDSLRAFVRYRDQNISENYSDYRRSGMPLVQSPMSILANGIDSWAVELEKAEYVGPGAITAPKADACRNGEIRCDPMSQSEIARRYLNRNRARPNQAAVFMKQQHIKQEPGVKLYTIRIDNLPPSTRKRFEKSR